VQHGHLGGVAVERRLGDDHAGERRADLDDVGIEIGERAPAQIELCELGESGNVVAAQLVDARVAEVQHL